MATEEARRLVCYDEAALSAFVSALPDAEEARSVLAAMKSCDHQFRHDQMFAVHEALVDLLHRLDDESPPPPESSEVGRPENTDSTGSPTAQLARFIRSTPMFQTAERKAQMGLTVLDLCVSRKQWTPVDVDASGHGTYYKVEPGCTYHSFLTRGVVEAPLLALAGVLLELDMYKLWYPRAVLSEELRVVSTFHRQSRLVLSAPIIANREVSVDGYGIDDLANGRVVIVAHGLEDDETLADGTPVPPVLDGNVRCGMATCGYLLEIGSREVTTVSFMMNVDPRIPLLPGWLIEFVSRHMMGDILKNIAITAKASLDPASPYAARRAQRRDVYDYIQLMVDRYFPVAKSPNQPSPAQPPPIAISCKAACS